MKKTIISLLTVATLSATILPTASVYAAEEGSNTLPSEHVTTAPVDTIISEEDVQPGDNLSVLDPYIKVIDNAYVLDVPENIHIDDVILQQATDMISKSNSIIQENSATIDPVTKSATFYNNNSIQLMAYKQGVNKVTVHWNYARIYLKKSTISAVQGGALGGLSFLIGKVPDVRVNAVASVLIGIVGSMSPKGGIWYDYNYFYGTLGGSWGWQ